MTNDGATTENEARALLEGWLAEWYAPAYRTARLILSDPGDAEDAVQDAFLRLWRFRDSIPEGDSARAWLYRVVVNACFSRARSENHATQNRALSGGELLDEVAERRAGPEELSTGQIVADTVREAVVALPDPLRIPLVLHYYSGLNEREIATVIHRRPGTVKSRLHEARRRLEADPTLTRTLATEEAQ